MAFAQRKKRRGEVGIISPLAECSSGVHIGLVLKQQLNDGQMVASNSEM